MAQRKPSETEPTKGTTSGALLPVRFDSTSELLADPLQLQSALDSYTAGRRLFVRWLLSTLIPGVDYQLIHRKLEAQGTTKWVPCPNKKDTKRRSCDACGARATLVKPGAEKICGLLQLKPRFRQDKETCEMLGNRPGTIALICELLNQKGELQAEGRGARMAGRDDDDVNKTIKMTQKSSMIDAVLRVGGLSEVFTQDLESEAANTDEEDKGPKTKGEAAAQKPVPKKKEAASVTPSAENSIVATLQANLLVFKEDDELFGIYGEAVDLMHKAGDLDMAVDGTDPNFGPGHIVEWTKKGEKKPTREVFSAARIADLLAGAVKEPVKRAGKIKGARNRIDAMQKIVSAAEGEEE